MFVSAYTRNGHNAFQIDGQNRERDFAWDSILCEKGKILLYYVTVISMLFFMRKEKPWLYYVTIISMLFFVRKVKSWLYCVTIISMLFFVRKV